MTVIRVVVNLSQSRSYECARECDVPPPAPRPPAYVRTLYSLACCALRAQVDGNTLFIIHTNRLVKGVPRTVLYKKPYGFMII